MAACSDYLEKKILDHCLGKGTRDYTSPANIYVALFISPTAGDLEASTFDEEVTTAGSAYARVAVAFDAAATPGGTTQNTAEVAFAVATNDWGAVSHLAIVDSDVEGAGNCLFHGALTAAKTVNTGDQLKFAIGDIDITMA